MVTPSLSTTASADVLSERRRRWNEVPDFERRLSGSGGTRDLRERINDRSGLGGANEAGHLFARLEKDQSRPQLHTVRASERTPGTVLDLDVRYRRKGLESRGDVPHRLLAMTAPGCAELEDERTVPGVDLFPIGFCRFERRAESHRPK